MKNHEPEFSTTVRRRGPRDYVVRYFIDRRLVASTGGFKYDGAARKEGRRFIRDCLTLAP